ncbi:MAG: dTDP-4-dehydrorhamnose 3,5-epimerase [Bacteroidota bacterium]|jgi:dTDP-4-dehydrorhamnose 3,5-epimerase
MNQIATPFEGLFLLEPTVHADARGYFVESFRASFFEELGLKFIQDNEARSTYGVIRGLHYQEPPYAQTKLLRVLEGRILDVAIDLRSASKTFGQAYAVELSAENKLQLLVPKGFAHGYAVLSDTATVFYKVDAYYNASADRGVHYDDFKVDWQIPLGERILSEKDVHQPRFAELNSPF